MQKFLQKLVNLNFYATLSFLKYSAPTVTKISKIIFWRHELQRTLTSSVGWGAVIRHSVRIEFENQSKIRRRSIPSNHEDMIKNNTRLWSGNIGENGKLKPEINIWHYSNCTVYGTLFGILFCRILHEILSNLSSRLYSFSRHLNMWIFSHHYHVVDTRCQGQGIGSKLVKEILKKWDAESGGDLTSTTQLESNVKFYKYYGFETTNETNWDCFTSWSMRRKKTDIAATAAAAGTLISTVLGK